MYTKIINTSKWNFITTKFKHQEEIAPIMTNYNSFVSKGERT